MKHLILSKPLGGTLLPFICTIRLKDNLDRLKI